MTPYLIALALFAVTVVLGFYARRAPVGLDRTIARIALGKATPVAWFFTKLGYARDIVIAYAIAGAGFALLDTHALAAFALLGVAQVASQLVSTGLKGVFKRQRPEHWLKRQERSGGYPSGHATTAIVTYGGIALLALWPTARETHLAAHDAIAIVAVVCACGILWSRLALGAHYLSDVAGGIILGSATLEAFSRAVPALQ